MIGADGQIELSLDDNAKLVNNHCDEEAALMKTDDESWRIIESATWRDNSREHKSAIIGECGSRWFEVESKGESIVAPLGKRLCKCRMTVIMMTVSSRTKRRMTTIVDVECVGCVDARDKISTSGDEILRHTVNTQLLDAANKSGQRDIKVTAVFGDEAADKPATSK